MKISETKYKCDFCKESEDVQHLIASSDGHAICEHCVNLCRDILGHRRIVEKLENNGNNKDGI